MGLILEGKLVKSDFPPEGAVKVFLPVPKSKLSEPYDLQDYATIVGEITDIRRPYEELTQEEREVVREILGREVEFVLRIAWIGTYDSLYIKSGSWPLLRDCGILPEEYIVRVRLKRASYDKTTVDIYPRRDVTA